MQGKFNLINLTVIDPDNLLEYYREALQSYQKWAQRLHSIKFGVAYMLSCCRSVCVSSYMVSPQVSPLVLACRMLKEIAQNFLRQSPVLMCYNVKPKSRTALMWYFHSFLSIFSGSIFIQRSSNPFPSSQTNKFASSIGWSKSLK